MTQNQLHSSGPAPLLPPGWTGPFRFEQHVDVAGLGIDLLGLTAISPEGREVAGSAASVGGSPEARARFELAERVAAVECILRPRDRYAWFDMGGGSGWTTHDEVFPSSPEPTQWEYSRSNGVAAGPDLESACTAARLELVERDRILRSWFGGSAPIPLLGFHDWTRLLPAPHYSVELREFSAVESEGHGVAVVGLFGFPLHSEAPFVFGTAAGKDLPSAVDRAAREAVQRLGFLWGEQIPTDLPPFEPTPLYHQEFYLCREAQSRLRAWLEGCHQKAPETATRPANARTARYVDLTPEHLVRQLRVVKALPGEELPLAFGRSQPGLGAVVERYGVHPIA